MLLKRVQKKKKKRKELSLLSGEALRDPLCTTPFSPTIILSIHNTLHCCKVPFPKNKKLWLKKIQILQHSEKSTKTLVFIHNNVLFKSTNV